MTKKVFVEKKRMSSESWSLFIRDTFLQAASRLLRKKRYLKGMQLVKFVLSDYRRDLVSNGNSATELCEAQRRGLFTDVRVGYRLVTEHGWPWQCYSEWQSDSWINPYHAYAKFNLGDEAEYAWSAAGPMPFIRTHNNAYLNTGDTERLLALLKISVLHRTLVSKNT
jgi:hypothetical protein